MNFTELKIGDTVERVLCGIPMKLKITKIIGDFIYCGDYKFSAKNGAEIDEFLDWSEDHSGSFIRIYE